MMKTTEVMERKEEEMIFMGYKTQLDFFFHQKRLQGEKLKYCGDKKKNRSVYTT